MPRPEKVPPCRVLIVDDHEMVSSGLELLISREPGYEICGRPKDIQGAREMIRRHRPQLILLDLLLKKTLALEFLREVKQAHPEIHVLVISMMDESIFANRCMRAGASGFIMKEQAPSELLKAMQVVMEGGYYLSPAATRGLIARQRGVPDDLTALLSDRELQVFHMIGSGVRSGEIAEQLSISPRTVHAHKQHIKEKLKLRDSAEMAAKAAAWVRDLSL